MTRKTRQARKKTVTSDEDASSDEIVNLPRKTRTRTNLKSVVDAESDSDVTPKKKPRKMVLQSILKKLMLLDLMVKQL